MVISVPISDKIVCARDTLIPSTAVKSTPVRRSRSCWFWVGGLFLEKDVHETDGID